MSIHITAFLFVSGEMCAKIGPYRRFDIFYTKLTRWFYAFSKGKLLLRLCSAWKVIFCDVIFRWVWSVSLCSFVEYSCIGKKFVFSRKGIVICDMIRQKTNSFVGNWEVLDIRKWFKIKLQDSAHTRYRYIFIYFSIPQCFCLGVQTNTTI